MVDSNTETKDKTPGRPVTIEDILPGASDEEIAYISEIINISRDKDGQIDANTTAKIKTIKYLSDFRLNTNGREESNGNK